AVVRKSDRRYARDAARQRESLHDKHGSAPLELARQASLHPSCHALITRPSQAVSYPPSAARYRRHRNGFVTRAELQGYLTLRYGPHAAEAARQAFVAKDDVRNR